MLKNFYLITIVIFFSACASYERLSIDKIPTDTNTTIWYTSFSDDTLDSLYKDANANNYDLQILNEKIKQSNFQIGVTNSANMINVDTNYNIQNKKDISTDNKDTNTHTLSLGLDYKIDLFNRYKSLTDEAIINHKIKQYEKIEATNTLYYNIAKIYYQIIEKNKIAKILDEQIAIAQKIQIAIENRLYSNDADISDIYNQKRVIQSLISSKLANTQTIKNLYENLKNLTNTNVVITKDRCIDINAIDVDDVALKSLNNRVDVKSAYLSILANDKAYASAISSQYPSIDLSISLSSSSDVKEFFKNWFLSSIGAVALPLFDGYKNENNALIAKSKRDEALIAYMQTIQNGLKDTKLAIINLNYLLQRYNSLNEETKLAKLAFDRITYKYDNGLATYLESLNALSTYQTLQRELITLKRELVEAKIELSYQLNTNLDGVNK